MSAISAARDAVAAAARDVAAAGLVVGSAGNLSARCGDLVDLVAVTGSGVRLAECTADDVVVVDRVGVVQEGAGVPTSEIDLHLGIYADSPHVGAVVHTHAPASTAVACVADELPVLHYQQMLLGGSIAVAPYATFGTPELADAVRAALAGKQAALMANHGSVAVGASIDAALEHALLLEWLCALHLRAHSLGTPRVLTEQQQHDVVVAAINRNYGQPAAEQEGTS